MEGDVESILPRPSVPSTSQVGAEDDYDLAERSRLKRERDVRDEVDKWDAWHACAGLSRTEAKRRYIEQLIQTMKMYAAGTAEARELVEELEFVWDQIRSQTGSEESIRNTAPAGAAGPQKDTTAGAGGEEDEGGGRLRLLRSLSRGGSGDIVEVEDVSTHERRQLPPDKDPELDEDEPCSTGTLQWRRQIDLALTKISTELAALREQIDELNLHHSHSHRSMTTFGFGIGRRQRGRNRFRILVSWLRLLLYLALRQLAINASVMAVLLLWGVWTGDERFERWVRRRWEQVRRGLEGWNVRVGKRVWSWDTEWGGDWVRWMLGVVAANRFLS